jgi:hypothetical protein
MIPLDRSGLVREGRLEGWWIRVQEHEKPRAFLVTRARAKEMQDTVVVDGLFQDQASLDRYFQENATRVDWQE